MSFAHRLSKAVRPDLLSALARFPAPVAASVLATVLVMLRIEEVIPVGSEAYEQALVGSATAFAAGLAASVRTDVHPGRIRSLIGQLAALALGIGAGLASTTLWLTAPMLLVSLGLLVLAAPGLTPIGNWHHNLRSVFALLVGAAGAGIFVLGLSAILATLRSLFGLDVSYRYILHAAAFGFLFVLPLYWLSFQPRAESSPAEDASPDLLQRAVAVLANGIFIPLLVVYAVILHAYAAKIALAATLPKGQIGWMVGVFLGLGYAVHVVAFPAQGPLPALRKVFRLLWPPATLVPALLLAFALRERVSAYGVTEDRYCLALIGLAAFILAAAWLPRRSLDPRAVLVVAGLLYLVGAVGPLSAERVSVQSQAARLVAVLEASGELTEGRFKGERTTPWGQETRRDLQSIIDLLARRKALYLVAPVFGADLAGNADQLKIKLGLNVPPRPGPTLSSYLRIDTDILFGSFMTFTLETQPVVFRAPDQPDYTLSGEGRQVRLTGPAGTFSFDFSHEPESKPGTPFVPRLVRAGDPRAVMIVRNLRWRTAGGQTHLDMLSGEILLREAKP